VYIPLFCVHMCMCMCLCVCMGIYVNMCMCQKEVSLLVGNVESAFFVVLLSKPKFTLNKQSSPPGPTACRALLTHCNTLQHTATHCNCILYFADTMQHNAHSPSVFHTWLGHNYISIASYISYFANTLQLSATHCNCIPYFANTLQLSATHCNTLQHTATHCNTLQLHSILL